MSGPKIDLSEKVGKISFHLSDAEYAVFKKCVNIFSSALLKDEYHLTNRELELLYCLYLFKKNGEGEMYSRSNISEFFSTFGSKRLLQVWLPKLANKKWITIQNDSVEFKKQIILDFLKKDNIVFNISYTKIKNE